VVYDVQFIRSVCAYGHGITKSGGREPTRERTTFSLEPSTVARIRQCAARNRGGASGYIEQLVRADAMAEAVRGLGEWYEAHPDHADDSAAELAAARAAEPGGSGQGPGQRQ
jgi:hypothetical protein